MVSKSVDLTDLQRAYRADSGFDEFRLATLRTVALGVVALAVLYDVWLGGWPSQRPLQPWPLDLALLGVGVGGAVLVQRGVAIAGVALNAGLALIVIAAALLHPTYPVLCAYALLVVLVATVHGWRVGFISAVAFSGIIMMLWVTPIFQLTPANAGMALVLVWLGASLAWLSARPVEAALQWAWYSYVQELKAVEAARDRQAELARLNRSLRDACEQLEIANRELERARRAAVKARLLRDRFAATVSHEMRTPLNLIIGFSEVMVETPEVYYGERLPQSFHEDLRAIYRNASHLSQLVNDILDLAQIEADHLALEKAWSSVSEIIGEAVLVTRGLFQTKGLYLGNEVPDNLPRVLVDRTRVRQIIINLLSNAARFTRVGGITIGARETEHDVLVWVRDTGSGIPTEYIQRIFDEFSQAETPLRREVGGTGLGLTISKRLAELHGGNLWAESEPGQGSTFSFTLPKQTNVAANAARPEWDTWIHVSPDRRRDKTVLALGSDHVATHLMQRHLEGYHVVPATTCQKARRTARRIAPAAAIVIASSASAATCELERLDLPSDLPVISCLVDGPDDANQTSGIHAYLTKPVTRAQLRGSLRGIPKQVSSCLIVDDDPDVTRLLARMIAVLRPEWDIRTAEGGEEALEMLRTWRPGVIFLDLVMPRVDGHAVMQALRQDEHLRHTPVIVVSAQSRDEGKVNATGFAVRVPRGIGPTEMLRYLKASLDVLTSEDQADDRALSGARVG
jgi:signal transduction histidine kinase/CheY-like chemotaxis protein